MTEAASQPENLEGVLRRVQKLLAIAGDERANPAEAAAASSQAEKIMRKFQIEHADVVAASMKRDDSFGTEFAGPTMNPMARAQSITTWAGRLGLAVGKLNDCIVTWQRTYERGTYLQFAGYKADAQVALWTYLYVVSQMGASLRGEQERLGLGRRESEDYRQGFVSGVVKNINAAIEAKRREMAEASTSRALVVVKHDEVARRFGAQKESTRSGGRHSDAARAGYAAGQNVDIARRGVGRAKSDTIRLN